MTFQDGTTVSPVTKIVIDMINKDCLLFFTALTLMSCVDHDAGSSDDNRVIINSTQLAVLLEISDRTEREYQYEIPAYDTLFFFSTCRHREEEGSDCPTPWFADSQTFLRICFEDGRCADYEGIGCPEFVNKNPIPNAFDIHVQSNGEREYCGQTYGGIDTAPGAHVYIIDSTDLANAF